MTQTFSEPVEILGTLDTEHEAILSMKDSSSGQQAVFRMSEDELTIQVGTEGWFVRLDDHGVFQAPDISPARYLIQRGPIALVQHQAVTVSSGSASIVSSLKPVLRLQSDTDITMTATPAIVNTEGIPGMVLVLLNTGVAGCIIFQDNSVCPGSKMHLQGGCQCRLAPGSALVLMYDEAIDGFVQIAGSQSASAMVVGWQDGNGPMVGPREDTSDKPGWRFTGRMVQSPIGSDTNLWMPLYRRHPWPQ